MKILKLTIFNNENYYSHLHAYHPTLFMPASQPTTLSGGILGGLGSLVGLGGQHQQVPQQQLPQAIYKPPSINVKKEDFQELVYVPLESIVYFKKHDRNSDWGTYLFLNHGPVLNIIETPEQINKMIHDLEFNNKIDKILSDK